MRRAKRTVRSRAIAPIGWRPILGLSPLGISGVPRGNVWPRVAGWAPRGWVWRRRAGAAGDGDLLLGLKGIPNYKLGPPLQDLDLGSFLDLDVEMQHRYAPVFTIDFLTSAGYTPVQAERIRNYLASRDPDAL